MKQRIDYIDIAKAVAIISVVVGHVLQVDLYGWGLGLSLLSKVVGSYHNYLFMFLSGMVSVTLIEKPQIVPDIYKRFRRFIVPAVTIGIPYAYLIGADVVTLSLNSWKLGYWYLFVLFLLYMINYPFALLQPKHLKWAYVSVVPLWLFANHGLHMLPQTVIDFLSIEHVLKFFPFFFAGSLLKRHPIFRKKLISTPAFAVCMIIIFVQFALYILGKAPLFRGVIAFAEVLSIIYICKWGSSFNMDCLKYIGRNTLYIYVFHLFALHTMAMPFAFGWFAENGNIGIDILFSMGPTIVTIAFSLLLKHLLERISIVMKLVFYQK